MKPIRTIIFATLFSLASIGCQKEEGPAERAGKEIDKTVNTIESKLREAAKQAEQKLEEAKKSMDSAGERAKKASDKMKQQELESEENDHEGGDN